MSLTQFDLASAIRVSRVVRMVEGQPFRARPLTFDAQQATKQRPVFRVGTFTGAWNKDTTNTVTLASSTAATASVMNLFANIPAPAGSASCAIARDGTAWYLIAAEC